MEFKESYRIGLYEKAMPCRLTWEERLTVAKEAGFDYLEMSIDETEMRMSRLKWSGEEICRLIETQQKAEIFIESICFSAQRKYPLGSKRWEGKAKELLKDGILFAKKMGIRIVQLQGYDCYYEEVSDEESKERFCRNLYEGAMFAASQGVLLAIETMENDFMNTIEKAMYRINCVDSPYLQVYPDIGNISNATEDVAGDIVTGKGHIAAAHLKETIPGKFREIPYGSGRVDFPSAIAKLYEQGVRRYVAEFWYCNEDNWKEIIANNRMFLDEQFARAQRLLRYQNAASREAGN